MAGASPVSLSVTVANAGSMGALGALTLAPDAIRRWVHEFREQSRGPLQINTWVPDPSPVRDDVAESRVREFLAQWGPAVPAQAGDVKLQDFHQQCETFIELVPTAVSSIMGLYPPAVVDRMKAKGIAWFATATTVD